MDFSTADFSAGFPTYETLVAHHPVAVKKRLNALRNLQDEHSALESKFRNEVLELEKKYAKLYEPIYEKRSGIVAGNVEPTAEQTKYKDETVEESSEAPKDDVKGIPRFWLQVLKTHPAISELITTKDEEALEHLTNIKYEFLPNNPGFKLEFYFSPNKFFTNSVLTKTYYLGPSPDLAYGDVIYDKAEGTKIEWKETMDLSVTVEVKKQRHKATNKVRTIKKEIPTPTFFNFFSPPKAPEGDNDDHDVDEMLESDYEIGELIKEKMIPRAVDWFTGKALEYEDGLFDEDDELPEGLEFDDDDDDDNDDDDDDDDADAGAAGEKPECKNQ
ncbi:hypothetical protein HK098_003514 [Nowakowskiella sp. JEL0407]|nr:hypothetical protein HK098_003514 [Nowakowskiella sp. JEL0407]